jgi:hypothetical protein
MIVLADRSNRTGIKYPHASHCLAEALSVLRTRSETAKEIIREVERSRTRIQIAVAEEPGVFGPSNLEWAFNEPCIIWAPNIQVPINATEITGYWGSGKPKVAAGKRETILLPPEIVLIHELGHAKQFIEHPEWFASMDGTTGTVRPGTKSNAEIEADNLKRHEVPVCQEFGLKQRALYDDFLEPSQRVPMPFANTLVGRGMP